MERYKPVNYWLMILVLALLQASCKEDLPEKPNVILFLVDDMGWTDGSSLGSDLYETPHLDKLVAGGVRFTNAYTSCTVCSPTRASIMTGKYPARLNCTDWITGHRKPHAPFSVPDWTMYMAEEEYTLAESLRDYGYETIHLGKWHLGETENYWPENQGFETNIGGWSVGSPSARGGGGYFSPYNNPRLPDGPEGEYLTERLTREALAFIERERDRPFFMNFWLYNVHTPLQAREEKIARYRKKSEESEGRHNNAVYAAMVEHMDDALGALVDQLKATGQYENTIIVFSSDNGGLKGNFENRRVKVTDNFPLRSGKGDMYEGGVRVPLVISWPAQITAGGTSETVTISPDIYPTIVNLVAGDKPVTMNESMDGVDLSGVVLRGASTERDAVFWHYPHYHLEGAKPYSAVRQGDWKLIEVFGEGVQLFNLAKDIGEQTNLAEAHPDKVSELLERLNAWRAEVDAQPPLENPDYDPGLADKWSFQLD